ncbi:GerMN domain-containing protein [Dactylosporangium sp. CA-092794]|uniref:GerMN domain-containing protein n=1 Tax=Dactylosporangium sp. CA-092794 TaxID=3239929 RepID=UPI003D8BE991
MSLRRGPAVLASALLLAGCGVPTESEPRTIQPSVVVGSFEGPIAVGTARPGAFVERLYLVRDNELVIVDRRVAVPPSPERQLDDLIAGPTPQERDNGLDSALSGTDFITGVQLRDGIAVVEVAADSSIRNDEILAYAQVVCTLAARADVSSVQFAHDGQPIDVPSADGSITREPLTEADYSSLIHR